MINYVEVFVSIIFLRIFGWFFELFLVYKLREDVKSLENRKKKNMGICWFLNINKWGE